MIGAVDGSLQPVQQLLPHVKVLPPGLHPCLLCCCPLLEHGSPQQQAPPFIIDASTLLVEHILCLGKRPMGRTHGLVQGDIPRSPNGVSQDAPRLPHDNVVVSHCGGGRRAPAGSVEAARSPTVVAPTVTFASPSGDTSGASDPSQWLRWRPGPHHHRQPQQSLPWNCEPQWCPGVHRLWVHPQCWTP
jgi:hypothetical protein